MSELHAPFGSPSACPPCVCGVLLEMCVDYWPKCLDYWPSVQITGFVCKITALTGFTYKTTGLVCRLLALSASTAVFITAQVPLLLFPCSI